MKIGGKAGYRLLRWLKPGEKRQGSTEPTFSYVPRIKGIIGSEGWDDLRDKTVLDFGCGIGVGSIEMAKHGAKRVIGTDIRCDVLEIARRCSKESGVSESCEFTQSVDEKVDVIVSVDAFEHFEDPATILDTMCSLLKDDGFVLLSFGPTWYHPRGGHLFSVFPWSGTDQGFGVSLEHEDGDTRGGRGRCWEMSASTSAARHAAKCAESGRTRNVA